MSDTVQACQECNSTKVRHRNGRCGGDESGWYCAECASSTTVHEREHKGHNNHVHTGLAAKLDDMDPDDL